MMQGAGLWPVFHSTTNEHYAADRHNVLLFRM